MNKVMEAKWWLLAIFLLALLVRIYPLQPHPGWDESVYIQDAHVILGEKDNYSELDHRPPLFPLLLAGVLLVWNHIYAAQLLVNILSSLIVIPLFLIGKELYSERAGLLAALIAALHALFVETGHYILNDSILTVCLAFAFYLSLKTDWKPLLASGILSGLAILFKFTAAAPAGVIGLYVLYKKWPDIKPALTYGAGVVIPLVPYMVWMKIKFGNFLHAVTEAVSTAGGAHQPWMLKLFHLPILIGLAIYIYKQRWDEKLSLSLAWFLSLYLPLLTMHIEPRFLLPSLIPIIVLSGIGLAQLAKKEWHALIITVLILASSTGVYAKFSTPAVHDYLPPSAKMANYIDQQNETAPIYATTEYPIYARYTDKEVIPINPNALKQYHPQLTNESGYIVIYDYQNLQEWADQNPRFEKIKEIEHITLYWYTK